MLRGQGKKIAEVVTALGVTDATSYRWRREVGGVVEKLMEGCGRQAGPQEHAGT